MRNLLLAAVTAVCLSATATATATPAMAALVSATGSFETANGADFLFNGLGTPDLTWRLLPAGDDPLFPGRFSFTGFSDGAALTDGTWFPIGNLTTLNSPIDLDRGGSLTTELMVELSHGADTGVFKIALLHEERRNDLIPCEFGGPNPCADLTTHFDFSVVDPLTIAGVDYSFSNVVFSNNGIDIQRSWETEEAQATNLLLQVALQAVPTPAPGMALLFGLGLLGVGAARRWAR